MAITGMKLRTAVPGGNWASLEFTAPSGGKTEGLLYTIEDTVAMAMQTVAAGEQVAMLYRAEKILLPKTAGSALAFVVGQNVYYDAAAGEATPLAAAGANSKIGICLEAAAGLATSVLADFNGSWIGA